MTTGRSSGLVLAKLRDDIRAKRFAEGDLLPSIRQLSLQHHVACKTVQRALRVLADEGKVSAEPRHGHRVLSRANHPNRGCPIASVLTAPGQAESEMDAIHRKLRDSLQRILSERSWSLLNVYGSGGPAEDIMMQLRAGRAWGVLLDSLNQELLDLVRATKLPAVMMDAWVEGAPLDAVLQDNYLGGYLAAKHLIDKGHREIAWLGAIGRSAHSRERFGGAAAAVAAAGSHMPPLRRFESTDETIVSSIQSMLSGPDRPTAVLALWRDVAVRLVETARQLHLTPGRDFDMVGWTTKDQYEGYKAAFDGGSIAPAVVWNPEDMARLAVARLTERWANPDAPITRLHVKVELKQTEQRESSLA